MILLIAALLAADPAAAVASPSPSPLDDAQANYDRVQQLYSDSCADRAYAAYDDLCGQLKSQVRESRTQLDRAERAAAKSPKASPPPKP